MTFHSCSRHDSSRHNLSKLAAIVGSVSLGWLASSLILAAPAGASVLVKPAILREETAAPTVENAMPTGERQNRGQNIVGVAGETLGFSTLMSAVEAANIGSVLSMEGPLTVFAPTDAAFAALPDETLEALLLPENRDLLISLLYNHVAYGDLTSDQLTIGPVDTFDSTVNVSFTPTGVAVDSANVVQADIDASNGVIHAVDQVLLPAGFAQQLQARIDGVAPAAATRQPPSISSSSASAPTEEPSEAATESPTEEPSTSATDNAPVRALW